MRCGVVLADTLCENVLTRHGTALMFSRVNGHQPNWARLTINKTLAKYVRRFCNLVEKQQKPKTLDFDLTWVLSTHVEVKKSNDTKASPTAYGT